MKYFAMVTTKNHAKEVGLFYFRGADSKATSTLFADSLEELKRDIKTLSKSYPNAKYAIFEWSGGIKV